MAAGEKGTPPLRTTRTNWKVINKTPHKAVCAVGSFHGRPFQNRFSDVSFTHTHTHTHTRTHTHTPVLNRRQATCTELLNVRAVTETRMLATAINRGLVQRPSSAISLTRLRTILLILSTPINLPQLPVTLAQHNRYRFSDDTKVYLA